MDVNQLKKQQMFFDRAERQYKKERILNPPFHTQLEINEIIRRMRKPSAQYVADFGAGSGRVTIPLLKAGYQVWAIEVSRQSLLNLQSTAKKLQLLALRVARVFPSGQKFAAIVGADILHHVNLDETIPLLFKVLSKEGKAVFSEPCALNVVWYLYLPIYSDWSVEKGILQCRYFHLIKKFKQYGFSAVKVHGLGFLPTPLFNWSKPLCILNHRLGNMPVLKFFAYRFIIEATK